MKSKAVLGVIETVNVPSWGVFGIEASELMATVQVAMLARLPFTVLRDAIFTHPTAAEGLTVLLADVATTASPSDQR